MGYLGSRELGVHCRIEAKGIPRLMVELQAEKEASPECGVECRRQAECFPKGAREEMDYLICVNMLRGGEVCWGLWS